MLLSSVAAAQISLSCLKKVSIKGGGVGKQKEGKRKEASGKEREHQQKGKMTVKHYCHYCQRQRHKFHCLAQKGIGRKGGSVGKQKKERKRKEALGEGREHHEEGR